MHADDTSMGGSAEGVEETLVEFRAGLMRVQGSQLEADPRRGLVRLQRGADGLPRFQWIERLAGLAPLAPTPAPEIEFILFPGEAVLQRVDRPGTRLFKLHFAADAGRSLYLWPQEPDAAADARTLASFNAAMADEGDEGDGGDEEGDWEAGGGAPFTAAGGAGVTAEALAAALRGAGMPPPPAVPATGAATVDAAALAAALAGATGAAAPAAPRPPVGPSLGDVLAPDAVLPLVRSPGMLEALADHLPETQRTQAGLEAMVRSAQFREQVDKLSTALATGTLSLATLGLPGDGHSVADLLRAVQASVEADKAKEGETGGGGGIGPPAGG